MVGYDELMYSYQRGTRNGNWRRLRAIDRVFYRAAMWYARTRSEISNNRIIARLRCIFGKLENAFRKEIMNAGTERAKEILTRSERNGVFGWAPRLKEWIKDPEYVFWLGLSSQLPHAKWVI